MGEHRRWVILCIGIAAQIASVSALFGVPFVLPELRAAYGLTIAEAGTLAGLPSLGLLATLFGWGVVIDRYGERFTMAASLVLTALALLLLGVVDGPWGAGAVLTLVGAAGGPVNAASGRLVLAWFSARQRGLAMGIRQAAQPLGIGASAALMPLVAEHWGFVAAMLLPAALAVAMVPPVLLYAGAPDAEPRESGERREPGEPGPPGSQSRTPEPGPVSPSPEPGTAAGTPAGHADSVPRAPGAPGGARRGASPYRHAAIWRVHGVSMLLGVPQFTVMTYALVYLVSEHGWSAPTAGAVIAATQVPGALSRLLLGLWSDRLGSRLRPVRTVALVSGAALLGLTASSAVLPGAAVPLLLACLVLSMSHNGLTFTAVAETAGLAWAGRAMAAQNSLQAVSTTATPLLMGLVITGLGLHTVFAVAAAFCAAAVLAVPRDRAAGPPPL
ncbi:MFS transporter [Streptomonospora sp. S1-112]|uniref:MFS transporter n=1 Tax=Streptomonospora mangrovi TaxID=2883123 RepID=A0A9X3SN70_9ACTN|nr:MFS transporter [Streptomonospora mangrovi]MDA0564896.1 MFS transporter [Streptomonospora mangrovi]